MNDLFGQPITEARSVYAVECRSAGYPCWCTIATERTRTAATRAMRAVRHLMPTAQHRGTLRVTRYRRVEGQWIRDGGV